MWLLLHLIEVDSINPIQRKEIYSKLETCIKSFESHKQFVYEHGNSNVIDAIKELGNESNAIERAKKLLIDQKNKQPIEANPSTTVHNLVKLLRELIEWYSYTPD